MLEFFLLVFALDLVFKKFSMYKVFVGFLLAFLLFAISLSVGLYIYQFGPILWSTPEKWGSLGDFFGGVLNPFFAFLSLMLLLFTLRQNQQALLQNKDALEINNAELGLTRTELSESREALQEQAKILTRQTFEGTFFQMLSLHQDLTNSIDLYNKDTQHDTKGKDCFKILYGRFRKSARQEKDNSSSMEDKIFDVLYQKEHRLKIAELLKDKSYVDKKYSSFLRNNNSEVSHYFKSLYNIVKFVDSSDFSRDKVYIDTIRSQLSTYELALLFYNETYHPGRLKFKVYIEKYSLFKNMNRQVLLDEKAHLKYYKPSAYGDANDPHNVPQ